MKKLFTICLFAFIGITSLNAQNLPGLKSSLHVGGGGSSSKGKGVAKDINGNLYITGTISGSKVDFDPSASTAYLSTKGSSDIFVAKYNSSGQYQWAFSIGSAGTDDGLGIAVDVGGNVYITGAFTNTADFDPSLDSAKLTAVGFADIFIAKYNTNGQYQWAFNIGSSSSFNSGNGITVDANSNVFVIGKFSGTNVDFDPSSNAAIKSSVFGGIDIFVAKYNTNGQYQFAYPIGESQNEYGNAIAVDANDNIYITGFFGRTVDFDLSSGTANLTSNGGNNQDIFVAKYSSTMQYRWALGMGGTTSKDLGYGIAIDNNSNVYVTGLFYGTDIDFDPSSATANLSSTGNSDIFIAKYNTNGQYQWAFNIGSNTTIDEAGNSIYADNNGNVYVTGLFAGTNVDFDPSASMVNLNSNGNADIFVAKYNTNGQYQYAFNIGGTSNDIGYSVIADNNANVYLTGYYAGTVDFDPTASIVNLSSIGFGDIFLANYGCISTSSSTNLSICSNSLPYVWNGLTFNAAGTQSKTFAGGNSQGCDSIATLVLAVTSNAAVSISVSANATNVCAGTAVTFTATTVNSGTAPIYQWKKNNNNVGTNSATYTDAALNDKDSVWCVLTSNSTCMSGGSTVTSTKVKMVIKPAPSNFIIYQTNLLSCSIGITSNVTTNTWNTMWSSSDTNVATVTYPGTSGSNSGAVKSKTNGTTILYCTIIGANGCTNTQSVVFKVDAVTPAIINGASSGCLGGTITLTPNVAGGVWSSNSAAAPVTGGVVSCNGVSTPTISYKLTNSSNCSATTTKALTINNKPTAPSLAYATGTVMGSIRSGANFCNNRSFTLVGTPAGGSWSSSNPAVATVNNAGLVNTVGLGTANITYTISNAAGCTNSSSGLGTVVACSPRGVSLTKDPMPNAFTIYPNPSTGVFNIRVDRFKAGDKIVITDILGKVVIEQNINSQLSTINSTLTKGMYLVSVITEGGKETRKIIVE